MAAFTAYGADNAFKPLLLKEDAWFSSLPDAMRERLRPLA